MKFGWYFRAEVMLVLSTWGTKASRVMVTNERLVQNRAFRALLKALPPVHRWFESCMDWNVKAFGGFKKLSVADPAIFGQWMQFRSYCCREWSTQGSILGPLIFPAVCQRSMRSSDWKGSFLYCHDASRDSFRFAEV